MTTEVAPAAFLLGSDEGEGVWFADSLLSYKVTGDETHGQLALAEVRAAQGSGSPVHTHRHEDEAWYILEGELTFWLGEETRIATSGDFVFGPRGVQHRFRVESEVARFLILVTPAGFEEFTRACGWPASSGRLPPPDLPPHSEIELVAAARRHGIDITSPSGLAPPFNRPHGTDRGQSYARCT